MARPFIVYQGPWDWDFLWNRAQPLAKALSTEATVLYLSPGAGGERQLPSRLVRKVPLLRPLVDRWLVPHGLRSIHPGLWVQAWEWGSLSPQQVGWSDYPPGLVRYLRSVVDRLAEGHEECWLLTSRPAARALTTLRHWDRILGDLEDPWLDPQYPRYTPPESIARLAATADVIFGNGPALATEYSRLLGRPVVDLPNGIDRSFLAGLDRQPPPPACFRAEDRCRIVFTGNMNERFDYAVLLGAMKRHAGAGFYFFGTRKVPASASAEWRAIAALPNLRLVPPVPHAEIPAVLLHADGLLLPYARERCKEMFPAKLYEYLAAGRPVLSTMDFGLRGSGTDSIRICPTGETLAGAVGELIEGRWKLTMEQRSAGRRLAERNTWEERAATVMATVRAVPARPKAQE
jgi:glycosyltransferase involved in cell wall biosynthesis